jgi:uncharacterized protein (UPF0332 family)
MNQSGRIFLEKAVQALEGAASEYLNRRYDNCANRCYFGCFQAAIAALQQNNIGRRGGQWGHDYVPAQFDGQLVNRRHAYPPNLRGTLERLHALRLRADYDEYAVSRTEAERALRQARKFIMTIEETEQS